ncbi:hypothetical protein ACFLUP_04325 [Chloroflexota bacterium]
MNKIWFLPLGFILLSGLLALNGCIDIDHKEFTFPPYFSFEYPVSYEGPILTHSPLSFEFLYATESAPENAKRIYISGFRPSYLYPDIDSLLKHLLSRAGGTDDIWFLKLYERSIIEISGIEGELFVYLHYGHGIRPAVTRTVREVIFVHKERAWILGIDSWPVYDQEAKADFTHILETFKILD